MTDFTQTIEEIEKEIRETPYHKGTEHHIGKLRARLARLKDKEVDTLLHAKGGGGGGGYAVKKHGDATVVLVGPPSAGKSTLLNAVTNAESKVAEYSFTTLNVIPGMLKYNDAYIQIFDVPGLIEGASIGKGRGKEVLSVVRNCDLLVMMTDVNRLEILELLTKELEVSGIRVNKTRPNIQINKRLNGGLDIFSNIRQDLDEETIKEVAREFGIKNADITIKERVTLDQLIDAFSVSRVYLPAIYIVNKIDLKPNVSKNFDLPNTTFISADKEEGLEDFRKAVWKALKLVKIYLVEPDEDPDFTNSIITKEGKTLYDVAYAISPDFVADKKLAKIWGPSAHYPGQEVPLTHKVVEGLQARFL